MNTLSKMLYAIGERVHKLENKDMPTTVKINNGGTGATTASAARKNLLEDKPLSVAEGGTGRENAADALYMMLDEYGKEYSAIPVRHGGTNATSESAARKSIVSPHVFEVAIDSRAYFANGATQIEFYRTSNPVNDEMFDCDSLSRIKRNTSYEYINEVWPAGTTKKVLVDFTLYFYEGFTFNKSRMTIKIYLLKNGKRLNRKWTYYTTKENPYEMYFGSCWIEMGSNDVLTMDLVCNDNEGGSLGYGDGVDTRLTVSTWD